MVPVWVGGHTERYILWCPAERDTEAGTETEKEKETGREAGIKGIWQRGSELQTRERGRERQ